jgi:O-methyltransferase involved in polyketide biosynthesis
MDAMAEDFIAAHGLSTLIVLGCGLDAASSRIDGRGSVFFELDLPDVIATAARSSARIRMSTSSPHDLFDLAWPDAVPTRQAHSHLRRRRLPVFH